MEETEHILSGSAFPGKLFEGSVAEFLIPKLRNFSNECVLQFDEATEEAITAPDFLKLSLEITEGLIKLGLRKGDVVILASPSNIRCHATATGIWFSGGILAPIDQNLKLFELKHLVKEFQPKFIICEDVKVNDFQTIINELQLETKIIILNDKGSDSEFLTWDDMRTEVNVSEYVPRKVDDPKKDILLISCSSGSTGYPKGVALSHFSFLYSNMLVTFSGSPIGESTILLTSSLFWISGTQLLMASLTTGKTRVIPKSTQMQDILESVEKHKPMFLFLSPAGISQMLEVLETRKYNMESVKFIFSGGSPLGKGATKKIEQLLKNVIFRQAYGITETAGNLTVPEFTDSTDSLNTPIDVSVTSVGKVATGVKIKVVDLKTGKSLGPNQIGECRVLSERMMVGYYNNKKATESAFDENGWFKTGDLVYYDEKNRFYVCGRTKEIIKYRNYQVSPEEVETFIMGLEGVTEVAVIPVPHEIDTFHLKALVVKSPNSDLTEENIIQSVKDNLSDPKHLRAGVQFVKVLPKTSTGKLRRTEIHNMYSAK